MAKKKPQAKAPGKSIAVVDPDVGSNLTIGGRKFELVKRVTVPTLRHKGGTTVAFKCTGPMYIGQTISKPGEVRQPPTMVDCIDLSTQRPAKYIVPAILKRIWEESPEYKGDKYVGKSFAVHKAVDLSGETEGRKYRSVEVAEIQDNGEVADAA